MNLPLAPVLATLLGVAAAAAALVVPGATLESMVMASGLPAVIAAAEPPLGTTARALLALGAGGVVAGFSWLALFVLIGSRGITLGVEAEADESDEYLLNTPVLRRADAHPDAPPRPPLFAMRDLGTPFLEVCAEQAEEGLKIGRAAEASLVPQAPVAVRPAPEPEVAPAPVVVPEPEPAERALPQDFSQPLAAFDPHAIPDVPLPPPVKLSPLRAKPQPEIRERFEIFELTPPVRPSVDVPAPAEAPVTAPVMTEEPIMRPETEASVHALLERLERGMIRHGLASGRETGPAPAPAPERVERRQRERGLEDALVTLRNLARQA
ncbi:MAG: hypothetical protein J7500_15100 [Sphingomonas sp.]|uniref:hypothetical protein n=1 Tax=Sphingomonas sp. TaxID=28214 RepID=UPI001B2A9E57|nr:hypothetical protein [Sphingomonas sp.]MBO9624034.1 hypothetical protein [Sphingomonas sp.]